MKFNINEYVRVKLTPKGKSILREQFEEQHNRMPDIFKEFSLPQEDSQGFSEWQMWHLFEAFGNHIFMGCEPPFELEIEIVENKKAFVAGRSSSKSWMKFILQTLQKNKEG